jgi:hypothetical protein
MSCEAVIGCAVCLNIKGVRVAAAVVVKGYSVCQEHVALVENPNFDIFKIKGKRQVD